MGNSCLETKIDRQLGVKESRPNSSWKIDQYLESVGLPPGNPWCSAYVHWCLEQCGIQTTITGWSPSAENKKNIVYKNRKFKEVPQSGDVFTIYSIRKKRIAHTGFYRERINEKFYLTNEGNAAPDGWTGDPYEGFTVVEKIRSFNMTYSISRWD